MSSVSSFLKTYSLPLVASLGLHAIFFMLLIAVSSMLPKYGASGGSQEVIDVQFLGYGMGEFGELQSDKTEPVSARPSPLNSARMMETKLAELKTLPLLQKSPFEEKASKTQERRSAVTQVSKVDRKTDTLQEHAKDAEDSSRKTALGTGTLGSYGTGGGMGGGAGGANGGEGEGPSHPGFVRAALKDAPKPAYPERARLAGFEGRVELHAAIDAEGRVVDASVQKSSGREDCDKEARDTVLSKWRFEPARMNGEAVPCKEKIVVVYNLKRF